MTINPPSSSRRFPLLTCSDGCWCRPETVPMHAGPVVERADHSYGLLCQQLQIPFLKAFSGQRRPLSLHKVPPRPPPLRSLVERGQLRVQKDLECGAICGHRVCHARRRQEKLSLTVPWASGVLSVCCQNWVLVWGGSGWGTHVAGCHHHKAATFIRRTRSPRARRWHLSHAQWCLGQRSDCFASRERGT